MKIKVISLWQPWATALALGIKALETRPWSTKHRGELWIHAGLRPPEPFELDHCRKAEIFAKAIPNINLLPYGAIIGKVNIIGCVRTESEEYMEWVNEGEFGFGLEAYERALQEYVFGDYSTSRFIWLTDLKPRMLKTPIPYTGQQGFFNAEIPDNVELIIPPYSK